MLVIKAKKCFVLWGVLKMNVPGDRKYFEYMKYFFNDPLKLDSLILYQIGETMLEDGGIIQNHVQECHEISCILSGKGTMTSGGTSFEVSQGDIHIVSKGDFHEVKCDNIDGMRFAYIGFDFEQGLKENKMIFSEFYSVTPVYTVRDKGDISTFFRMLINEWYSEPENHMVVIPSLINCILSYVKRLYDIEDKRGYVPKKDDPVIGNNVYNILNYIDNNIIGITNLKSIAEKFGYTENYVSHMFKAKTGMNIKRYITKEKMKVASDILLNTGCRISEVADRLGYSSAQSFSRMFRNNMGCSPSEFRERSLNNIL